MYGESSFTWEYVCGYETREQRKRRLSRRAYVWMMILCFGCITAAISMRFAAAGGLGVLTESLGNAWMTGEKTVPPECLTDSGAGMEAGAIEDIYIVEARGIVIPLRKITKQPASVLQRAALDVDKIVRAVAGTKHIPTVYLDPGHGGADEGCARDGVLEKDLNLAIALLVRDKLEEQGYRVLMSRDADSYVPKEKRVEEANKAGADIYISIHQNATDEGAGVSGMEVWYAGDDSGRDSKRLAQLIQQQTIKSTGAAKRQLRGDADFHVTGSTTMPACLIETGFLTNKAERRLLGLAEYQQQIADGIVRGVSYYFHPKTMYLTFDDGPSEENTQKVLDILRDRNIKATFFLVGENVRKHPEMARRIVAEGHTIGIHCDRHDYETLYESVDSYVADFEKARQTIYEVTGVETKLFRFPGGSVNAFNQETGEAIIQEMKSRGYLYYDWNASLEDAVKNPNPERLIVNGVDSTLGRQKVILLAHDVVGSTGVCLEELLDSLPEYEMRPLHEGVEPIWF